ncbi:hypothetical protein D3C85_1201880 [compost metagenome]
MCQASVSPALLEFAAQFVELVIVRGEHLHLAGRAVARAHRLEGFNYASDFWRRHEQPLDFAFCVLLLLDPRDVQPDDSFVRKDAVRFQNIGWILGELVVGFVRGSQDRPPLAVRIEHPAH